MSSERTALVLGGGGITGIAWEIGVLSGLAAAGVDLGAADLVVGTSAGSVVGAQLRSGVDLEELYARQLEPAGAEQVARLGRGTLARYGLAMLRRGTTPLPPPGRRAARRRRQAGKTPTEPDRRAAIASRLPSHRVAGAAAGDHRRRRGDRRVPRLRPRLRRALLAAVGASCAVPGVYPPVTIDGRRYIDGGMRSPANADLAQDYDRVVVLAPDPAGSGRWPASTRR